MDRWAPIPDCPGYEVSDTGRVRSLDRTLANGSRVRGRELRLKLSRYGYKTVQLGATRHCMVHRLVLAAFHGPCPHGMECAHDNGQRADNRLENLRWDTRKGNHADKIAHGTSLHGARNPLAKLTPDDVQRIRSLSVGGMKGYVIAQQMGVTPANVSSILKGKTWSHV